jgi:hypothetical protein
MKNALIFGIPALLLASCTPLNLQYKEGESVSQMSSDLAACEASALKQLPKEIHTRYYPPTYLPYAYCRPHGGCYYRYYPSYYGRTQRYDANEGKRNTVIKQCMADQGYTPTKIPTCSAEVARSTPAQSTEILPPLTENSCAIHHKSGGWQIVNPD